MFCEYGPRSEKQTLTSRFAWRSLSFSARILCCSALSALRFSCRIRNTHTHLSVCSHHLRRSFTTAAQNFNHTRSSWETYNSVFEGNKFLFFLLSVLEVSIDETLQLHQILVLTFLLDVLHSHTPRNTCNSLIARSGHAAFVFWWTYIKVHFLAIWDLGCWWSLIEGLKIIQFDKINVQCVNIVLGDFFVWWSELTWTLASPLCMRMAQVHVIVFIDLTPGNTGNKLMLLVNIQTFASQK